MLVEGPSRKDPSLLTGRTRQNKLVHFAEPEPGALPAGAYAEVEVTGAAPHHLTGEYRSTVFVPPRRRVRIPLSVAGA